MRNHTVAALCMILIIDILHDLAIPDRIIPLLNIYLIPLMKPVSEQRHHRTAERFVVRIVVLQLTNLLSVLPCNNCDSKHTSLLNPVFLNGFNDNFPVQKHPFFLLYSYPSTCAVVIRNALYPCSAAAIPHGALLPCSVVAVPDGCFHIGHSHGNARHARIVAGIPGAGRRLAIIDNQHRVSF